MSRVSDDDLRAVMRLRAAGKPRLGLLERIGRVTRQSQQERTVAAPPSTVRRRTILLRFGAMGGIAALLILAPLADALSGARQRIEGQSGHETQDAVVAVAADDKDDVGDAEDDGDETEGHEDDHEDDRDDEDDHEDDRDDEDDGDNEDEEDDEELEDGK